MKHMSKRVSVLAAAAAAGAAIVTWAPVADAATNAGGPATLSPGSGSGTNVVTVSAPSGQACPSTTSGVILLVTGPGLPTDGGVLTGNTDPGLATSGGTTALQSADTLSAFFQNYAVNSPDGDYTFRLKCVGDDFVSYTDEWNVTATFTHPATGGTNNVSPYQLKVSSQSTSTTVSAPATANYGAPVTITASVTPATATGTVQFKDGGSNLGSPQTVSNGVASFTTSSLTAGAHSFTAQYLPSGPAYTGSTSSTTATTTVSQASAGVTLASNGPTAQYQPAVFTATVNPANAGTVTFKEGATVLGSGTVDGTGHASYSTSNLTVGTHSVTATFAPTSPNVSGATSAPVDHQVTAFAGVSAVQNLEVTVDSGSLTIAVEGDALVSLGTAALNADGDFLTASGQLDTVKITDTRAGDPGWSASGVVTDFSDGPSGTDSVNGFNLGWTPQVVTLSPHQTGSFVIGSKVDPAKATDVNADPTDPTLGLGTARTFGTAPAGHGTGTAELGGLLDLNIPTDVEAGLYKATLTFTVA